MTETIERKRITEIKRCNVSVYIQGTEKDDLPHIISEVERLIDKYNKSPNGGNKE
jgi:hypothetical protein